MGHLRTGIRHIERAGQGPQPHILLLGRRNRKCSREGTALRLSNQAGCSREKGGVHTVDRYGGAGTRMRMGFCHCREIRYFTISFSLSLNKPSVPSGQRGADVYTGVHTRKTGQPSVTGKL